MYNKKLRNEKIFLWTLFVENASSTTCQKKASLSQGGVRKGHSSQIKKTPIRGFPNFSGDTPWGLIPVSMKQWSFYGHCFLYR